MKRTSFTENSGVIVNQFVAMYVELSTSIGIGQDSMRTVNNSNQNKNKI